MNANIVHKFSLAAILLLTISFAGCINITNSGSTPTSMNTSGGSTKIEETPAYKQDTVNIPSVPDNKSVYNDTEVVKTGNETIVVEIDRPDIDINKTELIVADHIDRRRNNHFGESQNNLHYDKRLAKIALNHSWEMARTDTISHTTRSGGFSERITKAQYKCSSREVKGGEIITTFKPQISSNSSNIESQIAKEAVRNWMDSDSHREGMLTEGLTTIGVGIYIDEDGLIYVTAILCA